MQSNQYCCPILIELELSRQFFHKYSNVILHGSRVVPCWQKDGQTWSS